MCESPQLVFDVANQGYGAWWFPAVGVAFMIISILLFRHERSEPHNKRHWQTIFMSRRVGSTPSRV